MCINFKGALDNKIVKNNSGTRRLNNYVKEINIDRPFQTSLFSKPPNFFA